MPVFSLDIIIVTVFHNLLVASVYNNVMLSSAEKKVSTRQCVEVKRPLAAERQ